MFPYLTKAMLHIIVSNGNGSNDHLVDEQYYKVLPVVPHFEELPKYIFYE